MKKILIILLVIFYSSIYAQQISVNFNKLQDLSTYTMDGDTSYTFTISDQYYTTAQFVWAGLDQTDGSVKMQISLDGTNFVDHPSDSLLFNSAAGSGFIRDLSLGVAEKKLRFAVNSGTNTTGTLKLYVNLVVKR